MTKMHLKKLWRMSLDQVWIVPSLLLSPRKSLNSTLGAATSRHKCSMYILKSVFNTYIMFAGKLNLIL